MSLNTKIDILFLKNWVSNNKSLISTFLRLVSFFYTNPTTLNVNKLGV
ncbi:unnamed protein product [Acanthoscelides obtectus]|uniref:Uncharacterized protein n=1 Tax=Acanthoscelides obtectus TaxID=200917 RepID=A0A9P0K086_ACAOB|nr:unnamed protein product [Acanthoscelides obtectus]CAK1654164.1 hypothetical protein AOBTE_LOCUS18465 [Acanthoscelides obtectus]